MWGRAHCQKARTNRSLKGLQGLDRTNPPPIHPIHYHSWGGPFRRQSISQGTAASSNSLNATAACAAAAGACHVARLLRMLCSSPCRAGKVHGVERQNLRVALLLVLVQPCVYVLPTLVQHLHCSTRSALMLFPHACMTHSVL